MLSFKRFNFVAMGQCQANFIQAIEQTMLTMLGHIKRKHLAAWRRNGLLSQVDF